MQHSPLVSYDRSSASVFSRCFLWTVTDLLEKLVVSFFFTVLLGSSFCAAYLSKTVFAAVDTVY